jgi:hypothetical protein
MKMHSPAGEVGHGGFLKAHYMLHECVCQVLLGDEHMSSCSVLSVEVVDMS